MAILNITRRQRALYRVPTQPPEEEWVYQIGVPLQLSAREVGIVLNIRRASILTVDMEVGNDLLILDRLSPIPSDQIVPLNRQEIAPHPRTGKQTLFNRYPLIGGFVPLGAKRQDGSPHSHAGTGFAVSQVIGFPADRVIHWHGEIGEVDRYHALEVQQYQYDGTQFQVADSEILRTDRLLEGWHLRAPGLCQAIPDGEDLVMGFAGSRGEEPAGGGILRWKRTDGKWRPAGFAPVLGGDDGFEATLVRCADRSLLFTARGAGPQAGSVRLWRSSDGGRIWGNILEVPHACAATPVTLNRAADGTVYIAGNPAGGTDPLGRGQPYAGTREVLLLWPLAADGRSLLDPVVVRDCPTDFGKAPFGSIWHVDHPIGLTVCLADGQWRHLLCYRVLEQNECVGDAPSTPFTGSYIEEVASDGSALPTWDF